MFLIILWRLGTFSLQDYVNCAEVWVEYTCKHFTVSGAAGRVTAHVAMCPCPGAGLSSVPLCSWPSSCRFGGGGTQCHLTCFRSTFPLEARGEHSLG